MRTLSSYADRVTRQGCLGGKDAGGSFPAEETSSACSATKSLYRRCTVQVRMGVDTAGISWAEASRDGGSGRTFDEVDSVRFGGRDRLGAGDADRLDITHPGTGYEGSIGRQRSRWCENTCSQRSLSAGCSNNRRWTPRRIRRAGKWEADVSIPAREYEFTLLVFDPLALTYKLHTSTQHNLWPRTETADG